MYVTKLSPSRVNTFLDCSFKYFLTYEIYICQDCHQPTYVTEWQAMNIDHYSNKKCLNPKCNSTNLKKLELPSNWGATNGSIIHKILELYAEACRTKADVGDWRFKWKDNLVLAYLGRLPNEDGDGFEDFGSERLNLLVDKNQDGLSSLTECGECPFHCLVTDNKPCFDGTTHSGLCPKLFFEKSILFVEGVIKRYDNRYRENCLGTEKKFNIGIGEDIFINGIMDAAFRVDDDTIEVVDYKTGKFTKKYDELLNDNQARMYSIAVKHLFPQFKHHLLTFDYFTRVPVTVSFSDVDDEYMKRRVIEWYRQIEDTEYPRRIPLRNNGSLFFKCRYMCDRDICDYHWDIFNSRYGRGGL